MLCIYRKAAPKTFLPAKCERHPCTLKSELEFASISFYLFQRAKFLTLRFKQIFSRIMLSELGIFNRKQESKKREKTLSLPRNDQEKKKVFLGREHVFFLFSWPLSFSSFFLGRFHGQKRVFFLLFFFLDRFLGRKRIFLFSYFLFSFINSYLCTSLLLAKNYLRTFDVIVICVDLRFKMCK